VPHATDHAPDCAIWGDCVQPYRDEDFDDEGFVLTCTHCGGEGTCDANADPLWDCGYVDHPCHACGGSGERRDQRIF
jgi:DnaJ-class molecular chaperone